ncbi:MAG: DUF3078 domain-containing protein [Bacteroidetes bacterium]|nr:MAG: DUF3078 domain-containing protein [Bacteroidota bacterium]
MFLNVFCPKRSTILLLSFFLLFIPGIHAQNNGESIAEADTIAKPPILFTPDSASEFINRALENKELWRTEGENMRFALKRLADHYNEPIDSIISRLTTFKYDSVEFAATYLSRNDTLPLRWLNETTFMVDTVPLDRSPFIARETILINTMSSGIMPLNDTISGFGITPDSVRIERDTIQETVIDTLFLRSLGIQIHQMAEERIIPPVFVPGGNETYRFLRDSAAIVISKPRRVILASKESPFFILPNAKTTDSLQVAVKTLASYTEVRDSVLIFISDIDRQLTPYWLSAREDEMQRFWVKNAARDSITLWVGNPFRNEIMLLLEDNVSVERREKIRMDNVPVTSLRPNRSLVKMTPSDEIPIYWQYGFATTFTLNQTYFSNWARGGESSFAGNLDVRGRADFNDKEKKIRWNSEGRLRYGAIRTEEHGVRTNTDNLELNSKFNTDMIEKLDFSTIFYFKTQVAKGFNYPNDSVVVSRFLNPGAFTLGVGVEYKPFEKTTLNFSAISYRNTFVLDTAAIDQTAHGIDADKRSRQELGGQLVIRNSLTILDGLEINNSIRIFSGYLDKPQNMDVDWEINFEKQISWFFKVSLNLHTIYDDDILFPVLDANNDPVLLPDGTPRRVPKTQFKQFLGLTLAFRL